MSPVMSPNSSYVTPQGPSPLIRLDLFPANLALDGAPLVANGRIIVTLDAVYAFQDTPTGPNIHPAFPRRIDTADGNHQEGYTFTFTTFTTFTDTPDTPDTPTRHTLRATPSQGCGCGSRLRSLLPWSQMRYAATSVSSRTQRTNGRR
jgi:hypothetical protein